MPLNACELEIDLFCHGLRLPPGALLPGARGVTRTRAGLGSGLEIAIPAPLAKREIWVNVPIAEAFVQTTPYRLTGDAKAGYAIVDERDDSIYPIRLPAEPSWYTRQTSRDVPMNRIGVMQGTYLGIYVNPVCAFWNYAPPQNCRFCTTGQNVGTAEAAVKTVDDVVETCWAAKEESGITFVHLNGGFQGSRGLAFIAPYVEAIKKDVGLLVGVQLAPEQDMTGYDRLIALGVDHLSFCLELLDPEWFARICPGKARVHGQQLYFDAMRYCVSRMPRGAVSGRSSPASSRRKTLCRRLTRSPRWARSRPSASSVRPWGPTWRTGRRPSTRRCGWSCSTSIEACRRHWLPIGAAPNIEVSLRGESRRSGAARGTRRGVLCLRGVPVAGADRRRSGIPLSHARLLTRRAAGIGLARTCRERRNIGTHSSGSRRTGCKSPALPTTGCAS